jgi:hypothetical protein
MGFLMAGLTYADGHRMAVVPDGAEVKHAQAIQGVDGPRDVIVLPPERATGPADTTSDAAADGAAFPRLLVARTNNYGVIFIGTILLAVVVSNVTFRGMVSMIVIALLMIGGLVLALLGLWDDVLQFVGGLDVRINAGGYLAIAVPLFFAWAFVTFVYDRQHYVIFDQGQIRFLREIGDGETVMDANGSVVEKKRDDVFRHWVFGLGTGDLRVRTGGANGQTFEIENVIGISRKLRMVHRMLQERQVSAVVASPMS